MKFIFLRQNWKWLLAPFLMTLASGFGQTYYIAVYGDPIRASFAMSHGQWGGIYMIGTLISAALMMFAGSLADEWPPRRLIFWTSFGLMAFSLLMALNPYVWALPILIFGLRFFGQGMMMHMAQVLTARWFKANRAKAMGIVIGGIALGEASFPLIFVRVINQTGWRVSFVIAAVLIVALAAYIYSRLGDARTPKGKLVNEESPGMEGRSWTRAEVLRSSVFWIAFPATACMAFATTIFFFQLPVLADEKGWRLRDLTALLPFFTIMAFSVMQLSGILIDKFGARRFMPFSTLGIMLGYMLMAEANTLGLALVALLMMGFGQGSAAAFSAVWLADFFGTQYLGSIRALSSGLIVLSTAVGPFLSGYLLDLGVKYDWQLTALGVYAGVSCLLLWFLSVRTKDGFEPDRSQGRETGE